MCTDIMLVEGDRRSPFRVLRGPLESRSSMMNLEDNRSLGEQIKDLHDQQLRTASQRTAQHKVNTLLRN